MIFSHVMEEEATEAPINYDDEAVEFVIPSPPPTDFFDEATRNRHTDIRSLLL